MNLAAALLEESSVHHCRFLATLGGDAGSDRSVHKYRKAPEVGRDIDNSDHSDSAHRSVADTDKEDQENNMADSFGARKVHADALGAADEVTLTNLGIHFATTSGTAESSLEKLQKGPPGMGEYCLN
jgi:hypothetical protein